MNLSINLNNKPETSCENSHSVNLTQSPQRPVKLVFILIFVAGIAAIIYLMAGTTYKCKTQNVGNIKSCMKYKISPLPVQLIGKVSNSACPVNPPSNCP